MKVEILDGIFSVFYFYFYLVFDDTKNLIKENQRIIKINLMEIREKIKAVETDNRKIDKQIENIQSVFENETDKQLLKLSFVKENNLNIKKENNVDVLNKLKSELDELNKKYSSDELTLTYYSVEQNIIDFFEKMTVNEKRAALIRIIKNCNLFQNYLLIEAESILFVFNIKDKLSLSQDTYNEFKNDKYFKEHFLENEDVDIGKILNSKNPALIQYAKLEIENKLLRHYLVRRLDNLVIQEYDLSKSTNKISMKNNFKRLKVDYELKDISKVISFTDDI
jgi:hypothetical protein